MNTLKTIGCASFISITMSVLTPSISMAEVEHANAANGAGASNLVHRVGRSLAVTQSYTSSESTGYKWGKQIESSTSDVRWADSRSPRSGYKWKDSSTSEPDQSYAGAAAYQWRTMNHSGQAAYKWGIRNYTGQAAYKWGIRNYADQAAYKWGIRNYADQAAYKWGIRNYADQAAYKWGIR